MVAGGDLDKVEGFELDVTKFNRIIKIRLDKTLLLSYFISFYFMFSEFYCSLSLQMNCIFFHYYLLVSLFFFVFSVFCVHHFRIQ